VDVYIINELLKALSNENRMDMGMGLFYQASDSII